MEQWELSDEEINYQIGYAFDHNPYIPIEVMLKPLIESSAQAAQKKLVEAIKEDTEDNLYGISDELWKSLCKKLEVE